MSRLRAPSQQERGRCPTTAASSHFPFDGETKTPEEGRTPRICSWRKEARTGQTWERSWDVSVMADFLTVRLAFHRWAWVLPVYLGHSGISVYIWWINRWSKELTGSLPIPEGHWYPFDVEGKAGGGWANDPEGQGPSLHLFSGQSGPGDCSHTYFCPSINLTFSIWSSVVQSWLKTVTNYCQICHTSPR